MDIFNLIRAVKCREPIWNRQHPQYKDRECSLMLWTEVANETGADVETARCKWRGLRDTFRVQLRKLNQSVSNGTSNPPTWEYFEEMVFVKDQIYIDINRRKYYSKDRPIGEFIKLSKDLHSKKEDDDSGEEIMQTTVQQKHDNNALTAACLMRTTEEFPLQSAIEHAIRTRMEQTTQNNVEYSSYRNVQYPVSANYNVQNNNTEYDEEGDFQVPADFCVAEVTEDTETRLEFDSQTNDGADTSSQNSDDGDRSVFDRNTNAVVLQKKLKVLQDDNYCFLMSILPQLKTLPTKQKLFVRIKIQELLFAEILNMENHD